MFAADSAESLPELPGVRGQLRDIAADLDAGLSCVWLLPDRLVAQGYAQVLFRHALHASPDRLDLSPPEAGAEEDRAQRVRPREAWPAPAYEGPERERERPAGGIPALDDGPVPYGIPALDDGPVPYGIPALHDGPVPDEVPILDDIPVLDGYHDGFDTGWEPGPGARPAPPRPSSARSPEFGADPSGLLARLGKQLSVDPADALSALADPVEPRPVVIGLRGWSEPDPLARAGGAEAERGGDMARLLRGLGAAVKESGLPPAARPRILLVARVRDLPAQLPEALELDLASVAVHWWWGTLGRLDVLAALRQAPVRPGAGRRARALGEHIRRTLREETIAEVCGPDLTLALRLADRWDGTLATLGAHLGSCLRGEPRGAASAGARGGPGARAKPGARWRHAWAEGAVQAWEGALRSHPATWQGGERSEEILSGLLCQAQQRVVLPWVEEARGRLARLALHQTRRPLAQVVERYVERLPRDWSARTERLFLSLEAGPLLRAQREGAIGLPEQEVELLVILVTVRNVLAHGSTVRDDTLGRLCALLESADRRWAAES